MLTEWLVDIAQEAGFAAQSTSIPGVAQRTGATTYYLEVFPLAIVLLQGRQPVFSLNPVPGALDAMVSSELLETTRQIANGLSTPDRTLVITSSSRTFTTQERMQLGDGRANSADLLNVVEAFSREHHVFDMAAEARRCGTVVSAVMLGAIAGSGLLPFAREHYESVVRAGGGPSAEASMRGFARGFDLVQRGDGAQQAAADAQEVAAPPSASEPPGNGLRVPPTVAAGFPDTVHEMLALGHARMLEYQDRAYGDLYLQRMRAVLEAERDSDPQATHDFATTREMARWLALWMAFDDIVRVADLKSRASRWLRVKGEVKAGDADLLRVYDHFKPGAAEFAALLPTPLASRVLQWDRKRVLAGKTPWALPLKIAAHSVSGMVALRALAGLKWLRVRGSRYANEQLMISKWWSAVIEGSRRDWRLGHEIALCGRLIKGYGATNERGKENLLHVLDHLAQGSDPVAAAQAIAAAREAALADDAGKALDATLALHGAPPRPLKEQPIRFMRRPSAQGKL